MNEETLKREIACLRRDVARRRRDGALANGPDSVDLDQQLDSVPQQQRPRPRPTKGHELIAPRPRVPGSGRTADLQALVSYFQSPKLSLLLQWCQSVCALVDVPVQNFSSSFSDGTAV